VFLGAEAPGECSYTKLRRRPTDQGRHVRIEIGGQKMDEAVVTRPAIHRSHRQGRLVVTPSGQKAQYWLRPRPAACRGRSESMTSNGGSNL
jgi:hypothetical protein